MLKKIRCIYDSEIANTPSCELPSLADVFAVYLALAMHDQVAGCTYFAKLICYIFG